MGARVPKQFLKIAGKPVLVHTLESLLSLPEVVQIVIALPQGHIPRTKALLAERSWRVPVECVRGGSTRQESVRRAVARVIQDADIILVHDAVRPLCDRETMTRVVDAAWSKGGAVPGIPSTDTIQRVSRRGQVLPSPPRDQLYAIQTPQAFRAEILRPALDRAAKAGFVGTDESSLVRWAGHAVIVVPGSPANLKITRPLDLELARLLLSKGKPEKERGELEDGGDRRMRIGHGIDYHRLVTGRKLILGGVEIPFERGLEGHSDADVLSHAICDALLGAAAMGDIGKHFPDRDPANRNRSSLEFLSEVRNLVEKAGFAILNVDATLLVELPRLAPYMESMRRNIAESLCLPPGDVNIKATTTEKLNAEGKGEGISSHAVALLKKVKSKK
jgi:2-C-methyl-D-erythritol 4-phosphate cytidylyltransferase/2-C-methyl-D-erythritol 2,4-cyclodiphosphate synthase